ncbi:MAG TPA: hypothetical protein VFY87_08285 [Geminicoccaceae bacterium]|nr:hypothetical protein [Geminicoccaceae bacterium]
MAAEFGLEMLADGRADDGRLLFREDFAGAKRVPYRPEQLILGARSGVFPGIVPVLRLRPVPASRASPDLPVA